jgi:ribonuclease HI
VRIAVLHLDESCLGNGREGDNPGGTAAIIECRTSEGVQRRDFYLASPATTNNRMALVGAAESLRLLAARGARLSVLMVSDSQYLVKGMREWVPGWVARDWRRRTGAIENLELWRELVQAAALHEVQWTWVRGHRGHPKNEYANDLAVLAAREQRSSGGIVASEFPQWLAARTAKGQFPGYDPDADFAELERRVASGRRFPLSEEVRA